MSNSIAFFASSIYSICKPHPLPMTPKIKWFHPPPLPLRNRQIINIYFKSGTHPLAKQSQTKKNYIKKLLKINRIGADLVVTT